MSAAADRLAKLQHDTSNACVHTSGAASPHNPLPCTPCVEDAELLLAADSQLEADLEFAMAWRTAEAVLPEHLRLNMTGGNGAWSVRAYQNNRSSKPRGEVSGYGPTPTAALLALVERLRQ